jgi:hypothetical protein
MDSTISPLGPGDLPAVFECLKACLNQNSSVRGEAEASLNTMSGRSGFCSCLAVSRNAHYGYFSFVPPLGHSRLSTVQIHGNLRIQEIALSKDADHSVRWLAAINLKNAATMRWRQHGASALSEEERAHLRGRLLLLLDQEDSQIAVQNAVTLARVARIDYPKAWPSLFRDLLDRLHAAAQAGEHGTLTCRRAYLALHHILKELSSKRLASDQRVFAEVTAQLLDPLWAQWSEDTAALCAALPDGLRVTVQSSGSGKGAGDQPMQALLLVFERWILQLKCLRRLLIFGFPSDAKTLERHQVVARLAPCLLHALQSFLNVAHGASQTSTGHRSQLAAMLDRAVIKLQKSLRQLQETHPWTLLHCGALAPALEVACAQVAAPSLRAGQVCDVFLRQCLIFLNAVLTCPSYKGSPSSLALAPGKARELTQRLKSMAEESAPALRAFWASREENLAMLLIYTFLPLTSRELDMWEDSGEEFYVELEHASKDSSVRACAEALFLALLENGRARLGPTISNTLREAVEGRLPGRLHESQPVRGIAFDTLRKAAVYNAIAIGAYELHDYVDFSSWLRSCLLKEVCDASPAMRPLRHSTLKVLKSWTPRISREDRPAVYRALVTAIADPDPGIHLTAVSALHGLVDDWEFDEVQFSEFVAPTFQLVAGLLQGATELEAQLDFFGLINLIIDRLGDGVKAHSNGLLALLPAVWASGDGRNLLRIQALIALQRLVHALGPESPVTYPVLLPILSVATAPSTPDELTLLEDGLLTWLVALRHAPSPHPGLLAPLSHLFAAMETSTEYIAVGTRALTSCLLLNAAEVLTAHGPRLLGVLTSLIGNVKDRGMLCLLPVIDTILQAFPEQAPTLLAPALGRLLLDIHTGNEPALVVAPSLNIFGRLLLLNPSAFSQLFTASAFEISLPPDAAPSVSDPMHRLVIATLDLWLERFDAISQAAARKLAALSLLALLPFPAVDLLQRVEGIFAHVTSVWFELEAEESRVGQLGADYLASSVAPRDDDLPLAVNIEDAEGDAARRKALFDASPVATVSLATFARQRLEGAAATHGERLNQVLNAIDEDLSAQVRRMLEGRTSGREV